MKIKKIRFNSIDVLIIIAIIAAIFTVVYRSGLKNSIVAIRSNDTIVYNLKINNIQRESFEIINIDDNIFSKTDDKELGVIVSKEFKPAEAYVVLADGQIVKTSIPDRVDVYLTVEVTGRITDEGCMIGGNYFIAAGKYISAYTPKVAFNFEVIDAKKKA